MENNLIALTSGRYDPPHLGHLCNILRIFHSPGVDTLKVVILESDKRRYPISYCFVILFEILHSFFPKIQLITNKIHFGEITKEELGKYEFDVYCGGNHKVLKHIENLGFKTAYFERAYDFSASKYPDP